MQSAVRFAGALLMLGAVLAGCGREAPEPTVPSESVSTDLGFSFDRPPGWSAPSDNARRRYGDRFAEESGTPGLSASLEAVHSGDPRADMTVTIEAAPPGTSADQALGLVGGFQEQSKPTDAVLGGDDAVIVTAREPGQNSITKIVAVAVHEDRIVSVTFGVRGDTPIEPLAPDAERMLGSWRWGSG